MNESYRLRYTNQIVGVFLLTLLVSILTLGIAVTRVSRILVKPDRYYVKLSEEKAADLRTGTEVIVLGKRIGQVESVDYADTGDQVEITLAIDPMHRGKITTESELTLERKFGLGTPIIRFRRRTEGDRQSTSIPLPPESVITRFGEEVDRVKDMAGHVEKAGQSIGTIQEDLSPALGKVGNAADRLSASFDNSITPAFDKTKSAFQSFEKTNDEIRPEALQTLSAIRNTTNKLEQDLSDLTKRISSILEQNVRPTIGSIEQSAAAATTAAQSVATTTNNIDKKSDKTNNDIIETLKVMRETITSIQTMSNEIRDMVKVMRGEVNDLPGTTEKFKDTVGDTQNLVQEIRGHWLLRGTNRDPAPTQQVSPSSVRAGGTR